MNKQNARETAEREHPVGATSCVLQISYMPLDARHVLISGSGVEKRERIAERFEFRVGKDGSDAEAAMLVETNDFGKPLSDVSDLTILKALNGGVEEAL